MKLLLTKEWLVKTDNESSTPYLLVRLTHTYLSIRANLVQRHTRCQQKFYASTVDLTCCVLITDTKSAWGEGKPLMPV